MILFILTLLIMFLYYMDVKSDHVRNTKLIKNIEYVAIFICCLSMLFFTIMIIVMKIMEPFPISSILGDFVILMFLLIISFSKMKIDHKIVLSIMTSIFTFISFFVKLFLIKSIWTQLFDNAGAQISSSNKATINELSKKNNILSKENNKLLKTNEIIQRTWTDIQNYDKYNKQENAKQKKKISEQKKTIDTFRSKFMEVKNVFDGKSKELKEKNNSLSEKYKRVKTLTLEQQNYLENAKKPEYVNNKLKEDNIKLRKELSNQNDKNETLINASNQLSREFIDYNKKLSSYRIDEQKKIQGKLTRKQLEQYKKSINEMNALDEKCGYMLSRIKQISSDPEINYTDYEVEFIFAEKKADAYKQSAEKIYDNLEEYIPTMLIGQPLGIKWGQLNDNLIVAQILHTFLIGEKYQNVISVDDILIGINGTNVQHFDAQFTNTFLNNEIQNSMETNYPITLQFRTFIQNSNSNTGKSNSIKFNKIQIKFSPEKAIKY